MDDRALFEDSFGEWLEAHGVELSPMLVGEKLVAHIDLNKLKPAIMLLIKQDREAQSLDRLWNIKRIRAKARIAVYHEVEQNWDKPSFKKYILDLHDQDLKILERQQFPTNSEADK
jgi:hypothetical protein